MTVPTPLGVAAMRVLSAMTVVVLFV